MLPLVQGPAKPVLVQVQLMVDKEQDPSKKRGQYKNKISSNHGVHFPAL